MQRKAKPALVPVSNLSPQLVHGWTIRVFVAAIHPLQKLRRTEESLWSAELQQYNHHFNDDNNNKDNGDQLLPSSSLADLPGSNILLRAWNESANKWSKVFERHRVYEIECQQGCLSKINPKYNKLEHGYEISLPSTAIVRRLGICLYCPAPRTPLDQLLPTVAQEDDMSARVFWVRATVVRCDAPSMQEPLRTSDKKAKQPWRWLCPSQDCGRRTLIVEEAIEQEGIYCTRCQKEVKPLLSYQLSFVCADSTGSQRLIAYDRVAQWLLGGADANCLDLFNMWVTNPEDSRVDFSRRVRENLLGTEYIFKLRRTCYQTKDKTTGTARISWTFTAVEATPVDYEYEILILRDATKDDAQHKPEGLVYQD